jgi:predicted ester cyclase
VVAIRSIFPDLSMGIVDQVAEGNEAVTRYVRHGTQRRELACIPPSGKRVEVLGMGIDYFSGGKTIPREV